jgi:CubicO group peptidase (beta-lactamase class C family)
MQFFKLSRIRISLLLLWVVSFNLLSADNEWKTTTPDKVGLDNSHLQSLVSYIDKNPKSNIHSILVFKNNKIVLEKYFSGEDENWGTSLGKIHFNADVLHDMRSVSKSVTSALVGIGIAEGKVPSTDTGLLKLLPEYHQQLSPEKSQLTLHHILTMTTGLSWFEPGDYTNQGNDEIRMSKSPDPIAFVVGRSLESKPGIVFKYNGGLPTLLGYLIEQGYGKEGKDIATEKLFKPLGIENFEWHSTEHGLLAYASGLRLRPRDVAKIGALYLNEGRWGNKQILDPNWVKSSITPHISTGWTAGYGYQWWIPRFASEEHTLNVPAAIGNGGQRIFIIKELDMMVVMTAGVYNKRMPLSGMKIMTDYILPAAGMNNMKLISGKK